MTSVSTRQVAASRNVLQWLGVFRGRIPRAARLAILLAFTYVLAAVLCVPNTWPGITEMVNWRLARLLLVAGIGPLVLGLIICRFRVGGTARSGWSRGFRLAVAEGWLTHRLGAYLLIGGCLPVFFFAFAAWKTSVPPFTSDATLAAVDRALHGTEPYRWLSPLRNVRFTLVLDALYYRWRYMLLGLIVWQSWLGSPRDRARFWLAFILTWVLLGSVVAMLVPSAGPCYWYALTGSWGPFAELNAYLMTFQHTNLGAMFAARQQLWQFVDEGRVMLGGGVSAFPSLHVAIPALGACAAWRSCRWLALGFVVFTLLILVGSVYLGWHYAVDGYASILGTIAIWWGSGRLADGPVRISPQIRS